MGDPAVDPVRVDLGPLHRPVGIRDLLRYEQLAGIPLVRRFFVVLAGVALFAVGLGAATWALGVAGILTAAPILGIVAAAYGLLAAVGFVWFAVGLARRAKIAAVAWAYADTLDHARRAGTPFTRVARSRERGVIASEDARLPFELGTHHSIARDRSSGATVQRPFAFLELRLPNPVPHIVLRNRRRSIVPTLGLGRGGARLELEGHFARSFTLLVPEGYQQDALYIFTPDLMSRVLDLASLAEIELVGERLYVYLPGSTRFDRPDTMAATLELAEEFHRRFTRRTERYRDGAAGELATRTGVAVGLRGQRLRGRGVSVLAVAGTAGALLLAGAISTFTLFGGDLLSAWLGS